MIGSELKTLREKSGMSVRAVAAELGYEAHSKYAYYESPRFKGPLPLSLAKRLASLWEYSGVEPIKVLELSGLNREEAIAEHSATVTLRRQGTIKLEVLFPDEVSLGMIFQRIFIILGDAGLPPDLHEKLAYMLPIAIENIPSSKDEAYFEKLFGQEFSEKLEAAWRSRSWLFENDGLSAM